jgi:protein involved in polysaccharide export with SLBB domain
MNTDSHALRSNMLRVLSAALLSTALALSSAPEAYAQDTTLTPAELAQLNTLTEEERQAVLQQAGGDIGERQQQIPEAVNLGGGDAPAPTANERVIEQDAQALQRPDEIDSDQVSQQTTQPLRQFGYELFGGSPSTFAPATNIPVPANYVMGPGDTVVIQLYGQRNMTHELVITREGMLMFPEIGPVSVAGLSYQELRDQIQNIVANQLIGQNASVTMGALRSINVFVLGEAVQPGSYTISSLSTMTNALFASGGVTRVGSLRNVRLMRTGELVTELDLYDLLLRGDTSGDARLLPGDVIFIPTIGKTVGIAGEVRRPAIYELKDETSPADILALSGGLNPTAFPSASRIERITQGGQRTVVDVDLSPGSAPDPTLLNGDVIQVFSILDQVESIVMLEGHVQRPGSFEWRDGMRVSDVLSSIEDMLPNPDLEYALIARETQPTRRTELLYVALGQAIAAPTSAADLLLQPRDQLLTFGANQSRQRQVAGLLDRLRNQASFENPPLIVSIAGNVRFPGEYPLVQGMTLDDVVRFAGGLETSTDLDYLLLERRIDSRGTIEVQANRFDPVTLRTGVPIQLQEQDKVMVFNVNQARDGLLADTIQRLRNQTAFRRAPQVVSIDGNVRFPGVYPLHLNSDLGDLLQASGGLSEETDLEYVLLEREVNELGEIEVLKVDLDPRTLRPLVPFPLQERDRLLVFGANSAREGLLANTLDKLRQQAIISTPSRIVSVLGNVRVPGNYPLHQDIDVADLIQIAGGLTESAETRTAELTRYDAEPSIGREIGHVTIDLTDNSHGSSGLAMPLTPYDQLIVRQMPNWTDREIVTVGGEVNAPGTYTITKDEKLSSLIARAGGLTAYADPRASIFLRDELRQNEQRLLDEYRTRLERDIITRQLQPSFSEVQDADGAIINQLLEGISETQASGRLVIDLQAAITEGSEYDVILRSGDQLMIPRTQQEVTVVGEVNRPTSHLWLPNLSAANYIDNSGGFTPLSDDANVYIIKANGEVQSHGSARWFFQQRNQLEAGDSIVVPLEIKQSSLLAVLTNVSQLLFNLSTTVLALERIRE